MTRALDPSIRIMRDAPLRGLNTFGIAATAPWLVEVADAARLPEVFAAPPIAGTIPLVLGGGSNILFVDDPCVPVLHLTGSATTVLSHSEVEAIVYADAGVEWHGLVMHTLERGFSGLENLALIPGTVGAAPIQNIGAYGVEVRERIRSVHVFEPSSGRSFQIAAEDCAFAYRDSVFKHEPERYIVTGVEFRLGAADAPVLGYAGIADELAARGIAAPTARDVADAVIAIRRRKLPDPAVVGNAGSFFKNPIVSEVQAAALKTAHPSLPVFAAGPGRSKLSAAWLIDSLGFKGIREGDAGIAASHALVLVNHGQASGRELLALARRVADAVQTTYGVELEPEPRIVGASWRA